VESGTTSTADSLSTGVARDTITVQGDI
jgi:hypothetical protein